ncbi:MAG: hypothetical protein J0M00_03560 [Burkholderiales bacterium]|nr:hypothetical protein [Burkholderiales bacterium]
MSITRQRHSTANMLGALVQAGGVVAQPMGPQPLAVLMAQKPWTKDKADLTVYNAVFSISGDPSPTIILTPSTATHLGSVQVNVRKTTAGKMFVVEFLGHSQTGNDFEVQLGPTLKVPKGDFKLPIAITASRASGYCRASAKNYGPPAASIAARIDSVKIWAVN